MSARIEQVSGKTYDFVVVGGGTAGLTLATRLSEDATVSVLVLEAGQANLDDPTILTPAIFGGNFMNPQYDWAFTTVSQEHCGGRSVYWPRGKGLGGSSAINFFQYHLPPKSDIDAFEKLGNPGWDWNLMKKYFNKQECFVPPEQKTEAMSFDLRERGSDGPLNIAYPVTPSGLESLYHQTLKSVGIERAKEPFSGETKGTWLTPISVDPHKRVRSYAANMYYTPNASRPNLTVLTSAHVAKLVLEKDANGVATAKAVNFIHNSKNETVSVAKEVVLSAGTIMSPQILELSGIGERGVLEKAGVHVELELPGVGNNVQEHIYCGLSYAIRDDKADNYLTFDCLANPEQRAIQEELYKSGKGAFGMGSSCVTFVPLSSISPLAGALQNDLSDSISAGIAEHKYSPSLRKQLELQLEKLRNQEPSCEILFSQRGTKIPNLPESGKKYVTIAGLLNHPISRGTIHVKSNDPLEYPAIDPHYFESEYDMRSSVEMIKFCRRLVRQEPLKSILAEELNPGPEYQSDEQLVTCLKAYFTTTFHTVGSCSMLPREDDGVVDTRLKVYNTTNIRVVDLSIIPLHIGAHTQATAYALGELGADIIKGKVL